MKRWLVILFLLIIINIKIVYSQATWTYYTNNNWWFDESSDTRNQTMIADCYGNLWVAPQNKGLWKYDITQDQWISYTNVIPDNIYSIFVEHEKSIWIGTETNGIYHFDGSNILRHYWSGPPYYDSMPDKIWDLLIDGNGHLIFTINDFAWYNGFIDSDRNPVSPNFNYHGTSGAYIFRQLAIESNGQIILMNEKWGAGGIAYITTGIYTNWNSYSPAGSDIFCYALDFYNNRWVSLNNNVYDGWIVRRGPSGDYDPSTNDCPMRVYRILIDNDNRIVCANGTRGVYIYDGAIWTHYSTNEGLAKPEVYALAQTMDGDYWFFHDGMISRMHIAGREGFQLVSFESNWGYNNGMSRYLKISGTGFKDGAKVKLKKDGKSDIWAEDVQVIDNHTMICRFDLTGAKTGKWHVTAYNRYRWPHFNYKLIKEDIYEIKQSSSGEDDTDGSDDVELVKDIKSSYLYPNVIRGERKIKIKKIPGKIKVQIYNKIGNMLKEAEVEPEDEGIDISSLDLTTGIYYTILEDLSTGEKRVLKFLFIK